MDPAEGNCELCKAAKFRYTCPKCNLHYCSVECYKSPEHIKCSEEFYKSCIQEELTSAAPSSQEDMRRIYEILRRIRESDAGIADDSNFADALDSDDDEPENAREPTEVGDLEDEEELDIATRLQGVDLNDAEEVWSHLSPAERTEFQKMIENGDIMKLVPNYKPWWIKSKPSKIVELNAKLEENVQSIEPEITINVPKFSEICKKPPSPCVHYNLWNILSAYTCVVRFFGGQHLTNANEAAAHFVNLSATLKYGTNFEDAEDAILSVETEALTTGNGAPLAVGGVYVESREQLQQDVRQLMSSTHNKLVALSDGLKLFQLAKKLSKNSKSKDGEFQKLFALCSGSVELNNTKLKQFAKKFEFLLAYVNREC